MMTKDQVKKMLEKIADDITEAQLELLFKGEAVNFYGYGVNVTIAPEMFPND